MIAPVPELLTVGEATDLVGLVDRGVDPRRAEGLAKCALWTSTYPLRRVKKHRRVEAICPMVAPALAAQSLYFTLAPHRGREPALSDMDEILRTCAGVFEERIRAEDLRLRCLVLVMPEVRGGLLLEATDPARGIKGELLRRGILVSEFFPGCPFATTFNRRLFALRSPVPIYVLRTFLESDWRFICQIPAWQRIYRDRFGEPPANLRHLGGPLWRLRQKIGWRVDALRKRLFPHSFRPIDLEP